MDTKNKLEQFLQEMLGEKVTLSAEDTLADLGLDSIQIFELYVKLIDCYGNIFIGEEINSNIRIGTILNVIEGNK